MATLLLFCVASTSRDYNYAPWQCQGNLGVILILLCLLPCDATGTPISFFDFIPYYINQLSDVFLILNVSAFFLMVL